MGKLQYFSTTRMQGGCVPEVHLTMVQYVPCYKGTVLRLSQTKWVFLLLDVPFSNTPHFNFNFNFRQKYTFFFIILEFSFCASINFPIFVPAMHDKLVIYNTVTKDLPILANCIASLTLPL